jgi:hypothetical protein
MRMPDKLMTIVSFVKLFVRTNYLGSIDAADGWQPSLASGRTLDLSEPRKMPERCERRCIRARATAHIAVTLEADVSLARHVIGQRNLAIAKLMRSVKGLRRLPDLVVRIRHPPQARRILSMVYDINTQLGIAFIDSLRSPDLVALGEALTAVLDDGRLGPGSRICVDCGQLEAAGQANDLTRVFRELYVSSVRRRPRKVALIVRDAASRMAAHTFVQHLPGTLGARTYVADDVSGAMRWLGRGP